MSGDDLTIALFLVGTAFSVAGTAVSASGWRHRSLIYGLCAAAVIILLTGVAWPLIKNISPAPVVAVIAQVATSAVAWFAVLMVVIASLLVQRRSGRAVEAGRVSTSAPPS